MQKEIDVFISYSRKDYIDNTHTPLKGNVITELKNRFLEKGISFWIDEEGIYSGDAFAQIIARNIKKCKIFVFVSSINSNSSSWTSNEIATAVEYKKLIIPLRIDDSAYHEDIVLYLAKLDYIAYYLDKEKGINRLIDSILRYKQEWEDKRFAAMREKEEQERIEREAEDKRKRMLMEEQEKKEQERLAAIALEQKRREEELTMILNQIFELEKTESELESKKDEIEKEKNNIEREILLIHKRLDHFETQRSVIELQLTGNKTDSPPQRRNHMDKGLVEKWNYNIVDKVKTYLNSLIGRARNISLYNRISRKTLTIVLSLVTLLFLFLFAWHYLKRGKTDTNVFADNPMPSLISESGLLLVENDSVYGIETLDKINWKNLNIRTSDKDKHLYKVSFALMKCTSGKNDYLGEIYEYNRANANKYGIYFASFHSLNVKTTWKLATGEKQAENYILRVGKLHKKELPPVLSIPPIEKEDEEVARERCNIWLKKVTEYYGIKPIIFVGQSTYEDYVKNWGLDNTIWMPTTQPTADCIKFQKLHYQKVRFYNDTIAQENKFTNGRLSLYLGTHEDFKKQYGE